MISSQSPEHTPALRVVAGKAYADWEAVYVDNIVAVYRLIFRQVGNRPDAEDLAEEVFLAALPRLRLPAPVHSVRGYLTATVKTVVADYWRRHYAAPSTVAFMDGVEVGAQDQLTERTDLQREVLRLLSLLPERFRQILELRFLRGLSIVQAAGEMGVSTGNARVLQHRALRRAAELAEGRQP